MNSNKTLLCIWGTYLLFWAVILMGQGCGMKFNQPSEQVRSYHERAEEALSVGEGVYSSLRLTYLDLRAAGEIDDKLHAKAVKADEKLRAAYAVAKEAVDSHNEPTIKSALQTLCALAEGMTKELGQFIGADADTLRRARITLMIVKRIAMLV